LKSISKNEIYVSTFHAFCLDFLKDFSINFKLKNIKVITQIQKEMIVFDLVDKNYLDYSFIEKNISINQLKKM
jgi:superfamily I DNA/RNA helicase